MKKRNEPALHWYKLKIGISITLFIICFFSQLYSQIQIDSIKTSSPPKIDGILDDSIWKEAVGYSNYKMFYPDYGKEPKQKTIVYSAYDSSYLYFAFQCEDNEPDKIVGNISKRDTIGSEDAIGILIDSHNDGQNAYFFLVNSLGIQQDGIMDSQDNNSWSPDFIWESMGKKNEKGYIVEVKIPFKTLRFTQAKVVKMRIGFTRVISRYSEQYAFPEWQAKGSTLGYLGECKFENLEYKRVFQVLPSFTYLKHKERNASDKLDSLDEKSIGLTAKLGVTSNLTLDFTINPDFSHIEMDEGQVDVNLRVDPLYEEKRPFFLEGQEHFEFAGNGEASPIEKIINTRNIVEPIWGLKLSGKLGKNNVLNSLITVDESTKTNNTPDSPINYSIGNSYYGVFRYKRLGKNDSYIGAIYTGKEYKYSTPTSDQHGYNRVGGVDSRLRIGGYLTIDTFFLYSFDKMLNRELNISESKEGSAFGGHVKYEDRKNYFALEYYDLSNGFTLAPGRLLRNGIRTISPNATRYIYPSSEFIKLITLSYSGKFSKDKHDDMNEYSHTLGVSTQLPAETVLYLAYDFATEIFAGKSFDKNTVCIQGISRPTKYAKFYFYFQSGDSPYYQPSMPFQGNLDILSLSLNIQPIEKFSTKFNWQNHIFHGDDVKNEDYNISIYRNKTIFQVNKYLSLRGIIEYNTANKNILADGLMEFTYIPGTVIHLGYGSTLSKEYHINNRDYYYNQYKEIRSGLFFKASYLFRF